MNQVLCVQHLCRCCARGLHNARATYERMWRHHVGAGPKAFTFDVKARLKAKVSALEREKSIVQVRVIRLDA